MANEKKQKMIIWIMAVSGYLISAALVPFVIWLLTREPGNPFSTGYLMLMLAINLIIWVPVTLLAFRIYKRNGLKITAIFIVSALVVSSLLSRGCYFGA